jgi:hypothetical protein
MESSLADWFPVAYDEMVATPCLETPPMSRRLAFGTIVLCLLSILAGRPADVLAGGGPENVFLVVNPKSPASLCIANNYVKLRRIPPENMMFLPWNPTADKTNIEVFRKEILLPILRAIDQRHVGDQIDMVVYSSDFPTAVTLDADTAKFLADPNVDRYLEGLWRAIQPQADRSKGRPGEKQSADKIEWPPLLAPVGSINGLTYLWQPVIARRFDYIYLQSNRYMRLPIAEQRGAQTIAFRGNRQYGPRGEVVASGGQRYFLSMMLGVTSGRGNSLPEILDYLRRSADADGTHPKGTIYFVQNEDRRSKVRHDLYPAAKQELEKIGVKAEIIHGTVPLKKNDVQGAVMGFPTLDWKASGSTILPGAICDNFTSYGGVMSGRNDNQTPLSEFLRFGAAGSNGTVAEPMTVPNKFPTPMIQVHYARGCTLAEAYYQSVFGPYQLLIVGDPLCQPWADIPQVSVDGVKSAATVHGRLKLEPSIASAGNASAARFELFVDGMRITVCKPEGTLSLNTADLADGYHELRVVAIGPPPIESQGRQIIPVRLANHGRKIEASLVGDETQRADQPLTISVRSPGSIGVVALRGSTVLARVAGEEGKVEIPANTLGAGPVQIRVIGLGSGGATTNVVADPLEVTLK